MTLVYVFAVIGVLCVGAALGIAALALLQINGLDKTNERDQH